MPDPFVPPGVPINPTLAPPSAVPHCRKCGHSAATKAKFTWWGGALGPRLFHVVRCDRCRTQYNGKTRGSLTTTIIVYQVVALAVFGAIFYFAWDSIRPLLLHR